jgi:hypothetical protein
VRQFRDPSKARAFVSIDARCPTAKPLRGAKRGSAGAVGHFDTRPSNAVVDARDASAELMMSMVRSIGSASDRVMAQPVTRLEIEFGRSAEQARAQRFLDTEDEDFRGDARAKESWRGSCHSPDDEDLELDRIATCDWLQGRRRFGMMLLDDYGVSLEIIGKHPCSGRKAAFDRSFIRTDTSRAGRHQQRWPGLPAPGLLEPAGSEVRRRGKQDKGSVSRHCITLCLHILFPRDSSPKLRDCRPSNGENAPFPPRNRETRGRGHA